MEEMGVLVKLKIGRAAENREEGCSAGAESIFGNFEMLILDQQKVVTLDRTARELRSGIIQNQTRLTTASNALFSLSAVP